MFPERFVREGRRLDAIVVPANAGTHTLYQCDVQQMAVARFLF
jgi:hypothetical protein